MAKDNLNELRSLVKKRFNVGHAEHAERIVGAFDELWSEIEATRKEFGARMAEVEGKLTAKRRKKTGGTDVGHRN